MADLVRQNNPEKIIEMIAPYVKTLYTVTLEGNKRALTARQLAEMAKGKIETVYVAHSTKEAVELAKENISARIACVWLAVSGFRGKRIAFKINLIQIA